MQISHCFCINLFFLLFSIFFLSLSLDLGLNRSKLEMFLFFFSTVIRQMKTSLPDCPAHSLNFFYYSGPSFANQFLLWCYRVIFPGTQKVPFALDNIAPNVLNGVFLLFMMLENGSLFSPLVTIFTFAPSLTFHQNTHVHITFHFQLGKNSKETKQMNSSDKYESLVE